MRTVLSKKVSIRFTSRQHSAGEMRSASLTSPPTLDAVQPDFVELAASRHFIPGDNMVLIANLGAERSHAQVIAVRSARGMVVVTAPFPKVCLVGRNGFARLVT